MPAVAWLRQKTSGSLAAGSDSRRSGCSSPSAALCACVAARSTKSDVIIPAPTAQPQRVAVSALGRSPASRNACSAATSAKRCERFVYLSSLRSSISSSARKPFTSAAMRTGKPLASNPAIGAPPLRPASSASHVVATSLPTGVTRPMPVIATRLRPRGSALMATAVRALRDDVEARGRGDLARPSVRSRRIVAPSAAVGASSASAFPSVERRRRDERAHLDVRHPRGCGRLCRPANASPRRDAHREADLRIEQQRRRENGAAREMIAEERRRFGHVQRRRSPIRPASPP